MGYNKETTKTSWDKRDENATMDVRSDTQIQDQGTTRVTQAARNITARRLNWYGRTHTEESVKNGYVYRGEGRENDRKQDGKRVPTRLEKYWVQSGRGDGQGKDTDSQPGFTIAGKPLEIDRPIHIQHQ